MTKRIRLALCAAGVAACGHAAGGQSSSDPILHKLGEVLRAAHGDARVVLRPDALALDPWMDTQDVRNQHALAQILDAAFDGRRVFENSGAAVSAAYFDVLDRAEWARSALTADQRRQLAAVSRTLFADTARTTPTAGYREFLAAKKAADDRQRTWDQTPAEERTAELADQLQNAKDDLALADEDRKYSTAVSVYNALVNQPAPAVRRAKLREQYDANQLTGAEGARFARSDLGGGYDRIVQSDTWTRITLASTSPGEGTSPAAVWRRHHEDGSVVASPSRATRFSLAFDLAAVPVARPWFDATVFGDRLWRWRDPSHPPLSDGSPEGGQARELLPYFATHALIAANIAIESDLPAAEWSAVRQAALRGETLAWGPFLVVGRYFDPQHRRFAARRVASRLVMPDLQIIGWLIERVPKAPNPDLRLDWGEQVDRPGQSR